MKGIEHSENKVIKVHSLYSGKVSIQIQLKTLPVLSEWTLFKPDYLKTRSDLEFFSPLLNKHPFCKNAKGVMRRLPRVFGVWILSSLFSILAGRTFVNSWTEALQVQPRIRTIQKFIFGILYVQHPYLKLLILKRF